MGSEISFTLKREARHQTGGAMNVHITAMIRPEARRFLQSKVQGKRTGHGRIISEALAQMAARE